MKKLILIIVLFCGLVSFNSVDFNSISETEESVLKRTVVNLDLWEITINSTDEDGVICCTATATYNGIPQASFTCCFGAFSCACASAQACAYIQGQGGTCPFANN